MNLVREEGRNKLARQEAGESQSGGGARSERGREKLIRQEEIRG